MQICQVLTHKNDYLPLLLLGDEQESMIARYLARGEMFVLKDPDVKTIAVVTHENDQVCELKNLATWPRFQRQGMQAACGVFVPAIFNPGMPTCRWAPAKATPPCPFTNPVGLCIPAACRIFLQPTTTIPFLKAACS